MKKIMFDPNGSKLWLNIEMRGVYFITYAYQLWAANKSEPPILTSPLRQGNNVSPHDDHYEIINDYNRNEPIANYDQRCLDINVWLKKAAEDNGYTLKVTVFQGTDYQSAVAIGHDEITGTIGNSGIKEEGFVIQLISK